MGADAVPIRPIARSTIRPLRSTTSSHSLSIRTRNRLHHHGPRTQPDMAIHRASSQRHHQRQLHRKLRLRRRYHPGEKRAGAYGMIGSIWGVGFIIGPLVGGLLAGIGPRFPFWGAAALSLASAAYGLVVLPESLPLEHRSPVSLRRANPIGSLSMIRARKGLAGYVTVNFLNFLAFQVLPSVYVLY